MIATDRPRPARASAALPLLAIVGVVMLTRLWFVFTRDFDPDEFWHLHAAWNVSRGLVPYRDFHEHHTPWLYAMLGPLVARFATDTDPASGARLLFVCRVIMWIVASATVGLVYVVGALWRDRRTGILAAAFTATSALFLDITLEIRPDVPALFCCVGSVAALLQADRSPGRSRALWLAAAGFTIGAAIMFTQKYVIALPVVVAASARTRQPAHVAIVLSAALLPIAATLAWFRAHDALAALVHHNLALNAALNRAPFGPFGRLPGIMLRNPVLIAAGVAGAWIVWRARPRAAADNLLLTMAAAATVMLVAMPLPFSQYYLPLVPWLALFQARVLSTRAGPILVGALAVYSLVVLRATFAPAAPQLADLEFVMAHTNADDAVLDGFTGYGVFRPNAWFLSFVNEATTYPQLAPDLATGLETGRVRPRMILFDRHLAALPARVTTYIEDHYRPIRGVIWERAPASPRTPGRP
jgi:hypothetical protein